MHPIVSRVVAGAAGLLLALPVVGCAAKPAAVEVNPAEVTITSADQKPQVQVVAKDAGGKEIVPPPAYTWTSSDAAIAEVDASGTVTAKGTGDATLTVAEPGGKSATVNVKVTFPSKVLVDGAPAQLKVGEEWKAAARVVDDKERPVEGQAVEWSSSDAALAAVQDGAVRAVAPGKARIEARSGALTTGFDVEVVAP